MNKVPTLFRIRTQEQILFVKRLSMILRSGLPILDGLHMLADDRNTHFNSYVLQHLIRKVSAGHTLSSSLQTFEHFFGPFCINVIRVGEVSGTLPENLEYIAEELKRRQSLRRKVIGALIYPVLIVVMTILITALLTMFIFPKIIPILMSVRDTLPLSTRILIALSGFFRVWWGWMLVGSVLCVVSFLALMRVSHFHYAYDTHLLHVPLIGSFVRFYNIVNICRTMSLLLLSDIGIVEATALVATATHNLAYRHVLLQAQDSLAHGQSLSSQFKKYPRLFPRVMVQTLAVGESTGNLSATLGFLAEMYEEEMDERTKTLTNLLEPILMIITGLIVGFVAISIIAPIYSLTQSVTPY